MRPKLEIHAYRANNNSSVIKKPILKSQLKYIMIHKIFQTSERFHVNQKTPS